MCPECPRKELQGKSCWLHTKESGPEVVQGPGGVTTSPTLLGHVLLWSQQNYLIVVDREVFQLFPELLPPVTPTEKEWS